MSKTSHLKLIFRTKPYSGEEQLTEITPMESKLFVIGVIQINIDESDCHLAMMELNN